MRHTEPLKGPVMDLNQRVSSSSASDLGCTTGYWTRQPVSPHILLRSGKDCTSYCSSNTLQAILSFSWTQLALAPFEPTSHIELSRFANWKRTCDEQLGTWATQACTWHVTCWSFTSICSMSKSESMSVSMYRLHFLPHRLCKGTSSCMCTFDVVGTQLLQTQHQQTQMLHVMCALLADWCSLCAGVVAQFIWDITTCGLRAPPISFQWNHSHQADQGFYHRVGICR